jgi:hypothetical protein
MSPGQIQPTSLVCASSTCPTKSEGQVSEGTACSETAPGAEKHEDVRVSISWHGNSLVRQRPRKRRY